jgi:hypothetical protein
MLASVRKRQAITTPDVDWLGPLGKVWSLVVRNFGPAVKYLFGPHLANFHCGRVLLTIRTSTLVEGRKDSIA